MILAPFFYRKRGRGHTKAASRQMVFSPVFVFEILCEKIYPCFRQGTRQKCDLAVNKGQKRAYLMDDLFQIITKTMFVPVHPAGWPFICIFAVVALLLSLVWSPLGWIGLVLTLWCVYFFRNPVRVTPVRDVLDFDFTSRMRRPPPSSSPAHHRNSRRGLRVRARAMSASCPAAY